MEASREGQSQEPDSVSLPSMDRYFSSYGDLSVHRLMLKDKVRTLSYQRAITGNTHLFKDKVVLDVGAGTGVLSMFAAKAGAKKVFAVEASNMADHCEEIVQVNGLDGIIQVVHGRIEAVEIPMQVDIIISEWMGFYLLHESMLDSVLYARDKWLKEDGLMFPRHARLWCNPVEMSEHWMESHFHGFYKDLYGLDFSSLVPAAVATETAQPKVKIVEGHQLLSDPVLLKNIDCCTVMLEELEHIYNHVTFTAGRSGKLHGFCFWFDVIFDPTSSLASSDNKEEAPQSVILTTAPGQASTHWKQTTILLPEALLSPEGLAVSGPEVTPSVIECRITLEQSDDNKRQYNITVEMGPEEERKDSMFDGHEPDCDCTKCKLIRACMDFYEEEEDVIDMT